MPQNSIQLQPEMTLEFLKHYNTQAQQGNVVARAPARGVCK